VTLQGQTPLSPPQLERFIAGVWAEVLGIEHVDPDADFLQLGGNSLHAVRIVGRVEEDLDIVLSVRAVLEGRTVRLMTLHVRRALGEEVPVP
jgi:acyl carrier protein